MILKPILDRLGIHNFTENKFSSIPFIFSIFCKVHKSESKYNSHIASHIHRIHLAFVNAFKKFFIDTSNIYIHLFTIYYSVFTHRNLLKYAAHSIACFRFYKARWLSFWLSIFERRLGSAWTSTILNISRTVNYFFCL